jgi:hypothetical protein
MSVRATRLSEKEGVGIVVSEERAFEARAHVVVSLTLARLHVNM